MKTRKRAVFIDRDGTMTVEGGYINDPNRLTLLPRCGRAIKKINENGILAILATNQAGIARGYFDEKTLKATLKRLEFLLEMEGAHLDGIYYCCHHPSVGKPPYRKKCNCRKPLPGMLQKAAKDFNLDLSQSFVIGDKISDVELAKKVKAKSVVVKTGYGEGEICTDKMQKINPDFIADDIYDAVEWILSEIKND
ncbi:MAG: HAD-IIIA family hydrolase [Candidatus Schekmanbacteria bacterium]|nr:MAG: HAD-IIIA family hydrolase [Candidatus Schekmanbacteria bacterium]